VTVTVGGTPFSFTFAAGSTEAKVIDNVPTGTMLSAESEMDLSDGAWGTGGAGTPLCAVAAPAVIQSGDNTITMYARYPLVCQMFSDAAGQGAAITGTAPAYYTNGSPTPLPAATESYVADGTTMRFAGWALTDGGTPVISGSVPSTGVYKGKLTLYATYSECTVSISTGAAGTDPILAEGETLALTAVPAGFPSAPAYTWSIESPAADAPVTVSSSGVVSPVPGKSGSATIKVTATCGTLTATATQNVSVAALSVTGAAAVEAMRLADGSKSVSASVSGYTGTVEYSWTSSSTAVAAVSPADSASVTVAPASGGITTLSVTAVLKDGSGNTIKVLPAKTIDAAVLEVVLGGSGLPADTTDPIVLTAGSTETAALTASLRGITSGVTYAWESGAPSLFTVSPANTSGTTVTPVAAGSDSVTATLTYRGVSVSASRNVSVAGIVFTTFPTSFAMGGATSSCSLAAEVQGFSGTVTWGTWTSGTAAVATVTGQTDSGTSSSVTLNALRGGKTRITVTATAGGVTLSAEKDICVLQLSLACGDSSFTPPSSLTDTSYKLTLIKGDPVATSITADLVGLPAADVSYTWTPETSTKLTMTTSGTGNKTIRLAPAAAGNETVSVQATYDGESITKSVDVSVVGIRLTGSSTHEFDSDPAAPATANQITLSATLENIELAALTSSGIGFSSNDTSIATVTAGTATSTGRPVTVTALKGGKVTVTVTAALGSTGRVFSATKEIAILKLNVTDAAGDPVPATGNRILLGGTKALTAVLEDIPAADVEYEWTSSADTKISLSPMDEADTTLTGVALGDANISVTATYKGTATCTSPTMAFSAALGTKPAPDAVGDIVFTDGSAEPYVDGMTLTDEQKAAAIAVIFYKGTDLNNGDDTTTVRTLGKGLINSSSSLYFVNPPCTGWATITYIQCTASYLSSGYSVTGGYKNGSNALEEIGRWCNDNSQTDQTGNSSKYPALYWAKNYKEKLMTGETTSRLIGTDFEDGWYLPTFAEMCKFQTSTAVATTIKNAIELCGGDYFAIGSSNIYYWTACQRTSSNGYMPFRFESLTSNGSLGNCWTSTSGDYYKACAIREF